MCPGRGWTEDKVACVGGGVRQGHSQSHNTPLANTRETKLPAQPIQIHSHHMTTLLWKWEHVCVCVCGIVPGVEWSSWFPLESETSGFREIHFPVGIDRLY